MNATLRILVLIWVALCGLFDTGTSSGVSAAFPQPVAENASPFDYDVLNQRKIGYDGPLMLSTAARRGFWEFTAAFAPTSRFLAAEGGTPLFRAVTEGELNSIKQTGRFSVVPGSSTPVPGVQGKWFYGGLEDAQNWAAQAAARDGGPLTIIQTTVPKSVGPAFSQPWVDSIKNPALFYDLGNLNAPIKILPGTVP